MAAANSTKDSNYYIIDGLNVCLWNNAKASLAILLTLLIKIQEKGGSFSCIFDASAGFDWLKGDNLTNYKKLLQSYPDYFTEISGGSRADEFILLRADTSGGKIISNDRFRDYESRYNWIKSSPGRLIKGKLIGNGLVIPDLKIDTPVSDDINHLIEQLGSSLVPPKTSRLPRNKNRSSKTELNDEFGFAILYGSTNGYWYQDIPHDAANRLEELHNEGQHIRSIAATPDGGCVILYDELNAYWYHNISNEAVEALEELNSECSYIHDISFAPDGSWVILCNRNGYYCADDVPDDLYQALEQLSGETDWIQQVAFSPDGGWIIFYGDNGYWYEGIPEKASEIVEHLCDNSQNPFHISFTPNGGWIILYGKNGYRASGLPDNIKKPIKELRKMHTIVFFKEEEDES